MCVCVCVCVCNRNKYRTVNSERETGHGKKQDRQQKECIYRIITTGGGGGGGGGRLKAGWEMEEVRGHVSGVAVDFNLFNPSAAFRKSGFGGVFQEKRIKTNLPES